MSKVYNEFTGSTYIYDPETDVDEWWVCSAGNPGHSGIGHSTHTSFRDAKLAQITLFLDEGIDAWIEHVPASGPPTIEQQLNAEQLENNHAIQ